MEEQYFCEYCGKTFTESEMYDGISWLPACKKCGEIQEDNFVE